MSKFNKHNVEELRLYLYNSCIHDARIENVCYQREKRTIVVEIFSSIYSKKINLIFYDVRVVLFIKGKAYGCHETINSLSVEDNEEYLQTYIAKGSECAKGALCLLFQMFSEDELHIVADELLVEEDRLTIKSQDPN